MSHVFYSAQRKVKDSLYDRPVAPHLSCRGQCSSTMLHLHREFTMKMQDKSELFLFLLLPFPKLYDSFTYCVLCICLFKHFTEAKRRQISFIHFSMLQHHNKWKYSTCLVISCYVCFPRIQSDRFGVFGNFSVSTRI